MTGEEKTEQRLLQIERWIDRNKCAQHQEGLIRIEGKLQELERRGEERHQILDTAMNERKKEIETETTRRRNDIITIFDKLDNFKTDIRKDTSDLKDAMLENRSTLKSWTVAAVVVLTAAQLLPKLLPLLK